MASIFSDLVVYPYMYYLIVLIVTLLPLNAVGNERLFSEEEQQDLKHAHWVMFGDKGQRRTALRQIARERNQKMVAPLVYALRFSGGNVRPDIVSTLEKVTRKSYGDDWFKWTEWIQDRPELGTIAGFDIYLSYLLKSLDSRFSLFVYPGVAHDIPLHEIVWGGVAAFDGIPPLDHPKMIAAQDADYLGENELVFGVAINGETRAYPYRFMDWHEMLNDTVGGQSVSLAYCTLCSSGILYDTSLPDGTVKFGSSGLLYRSNKLMFDYATNSLWNQFTGQPAVGKLVGSGLQLEVLPLVTTTWREWRTSHPTTQVMHPETGFVRDYTPGKPYGSYFKDRALMFPSPDDERTLAQKALVFGLRVSGSAKAWPLKAFRRGAVVNEQLGTLNVVLLGSEANRDVRAYRRGEINFDKQEGAQLWDSQGGKWRVTESALVGPDNQRLTRLPGHLGYWFAWHNYFGVETLAE